MKSRDEKIFSAFIEDQTNSAAAAALQAVLSGKERLLLITGPTGCGKSHLLLAAKAALKERALYMTAEELCEELLRLSDEEWDPPSVVEVLLVDGMEDLKDKPFTQELFCRKLLDFYSDGGKVVLASSIPLGKLPGAQRVLRQNIGLSLAAVNPPGEALRRRMISRWSKELGLPLTREAVDFLAGKELDPGRLLGLLRQLKFAYDIKGEEITPRWMKDRIEW